MPKPKQFLKDNKKKSKHAQQAPETADEYLAAGVDFEEAGEKWRGGDAVKSTRFFVRAIDCYDEALKKFPRSFDLAYNKARVQYELTQHPKLKNQLPGSLLDLLKTALDSSRYALALKEDNADVLFNTAQVLTSLAQLTEDNRNPTYDPLPLLEEALELFQRCLTLQEYNYTVSLAQQDAIAAENTDSQPSSTVDPGDGGVPLTSSSDSQEEERWATILEPITNNTLLDTLLAQLETLTTLSSMIPISSGNSKPLSWIEEYSTPLLTLKLPAYLAGTERDQEAGLTRANFVAALGDANFRAGRIDGDTYSRALDEAFRALDLSANPEGLTNHAEALLSYASSLRTSTSSSAPSLSQRWKALSTALTSLTRASTLPNNDAENLAKIHILRGDTELLRHALSREGLPTAQHNAAILLKNAGKFYRGAALVAANGGRGLEKEFREASAKEALAIALSGDRVKLEEILKRDAEAVRMVFEEVVEDGLVGVDELRGVGIV